jgi:hypothetical protein
MAQMLEAERFNADKLEDSQLLEIGSFKLRVKMERKTKMINQTTKSSPQELHNYQNAPV